MEELSRCTFQPELISTQSHGRHRTVHMADGPPGSPSWHTKSEMNYMESGTAEGVFFAALGAALCLSLLVVFHHSGRNC